MRASTLNLLLLQGLAVGSPGADFGAESCESVLRFPCQHGRLEFLEFETAIESLEIRCDPIYLWGEILAENNGTLCQGQDDCREVTLPLDTQNATTATECGEQLCHRLSTAASKLQCDPAQDFGSPMDAYDYTSFVTMLTPLKHRLLRSRPNAVSPTSSSCIPTSAAQTMLVGMVSGLITFGILAIMLLVGWRTIKLRQKLLEILQEDATEATSVCSASDSESITLESPGHADGIPLVLPRSSKRKIYVIYVDSQKSNGDDLQPELVDEDWSAILHKSGCQHPADIVVQHLSSKPDEGNGQVSLHSESTSK